MHELDGWTLLAILGMTAISVITRGFFFISEREWTLPEWAMGWEVDIGLSSVGCGSV